MDARKNVKFGLMEKRSEDQLSQESSNNSAEWQFGTCLMGMVPAIPSIAVGHPASMVEPSSASLCNQSSNSLLLSFCENAIQSNTSTTVNMPVGKPVAVSPRRLLLPASFSGSLPTFAERALRFSCANGDSLSSPFELPCPSPNAHKSETNVSELPEAEVASVSVDSRSNSESPMEKQREKGHYGTEGEQEEIHNMAVAAGNSSTNDPCAKKRKRTNQNVKLSHAQGVQSLPIETRKENSETKQKVEHNNSKTNSSKRAKDSSEETNEDFIHVRARRGQATNSHSLAERVRREKINERMKYLQDLVPGCSKVTGKALMLDEIINYVQSLQRQIEFLSMKLAAVNPQQDLNIEGILSKDLLQSYVGSSSIVGFSPDMIYPQLHPSQQLLVSAGIIGMVNPADACRHVANTQFAAINAYKEANIQICNAWGSELQNVMEMNCGTNSSYCPRETNSKPRDGYPVSNYHPC
ncbi:uncharacterized protein [Typha angustifolia]|uniref:uncharacterized protein isoform X1 n=1 Tax=Typha angustifolia TaxID=59011 RepID=UPI003C3012FF